MNQETGYYLNEEPRIPEELGPWYNHEFINYYVAQAQDWLMDLPKVDIQANPDFGDWPVGPEHVDQYLTSFSPNEDFDETNTQQSAFKYSIYAQEPFDGKVEPWKIFVLYSIEPDWELDCGVNLHWMQKLTGGSHALRHMRFKLFGLPIGDAKKSLYYYIDAAKRAEARGNLYWKWRFATRASHYAADLGHPFHVNLAPFKDMFKLFTGFKEFLKFLSATHTGHEAYVLERFRENFEPFKIALQEGARSASSYAFNFDDALDPYRKKCSRMMSPIHELLIDNFGDDLMNAYDVVNDPQYANLDLSKRTSIARTGVVALLFKDPESEALKELDKLTAELLFNVGRMLVLLLQKVR